MVKILFLLCGLILMIGLSACEVKTPEIHGLVLDAETKQPVEGAWIRAVVGVKTKTVAGDVGRFIGLHQPHTRTDKDGKFLIPSRSIKKPPFPVSFGTEVEDIVIAAHTVDDRIGSVTLEGDEFRKFLKKSKADVTLYSKFEQWKEEEYFSHLQTLYDYCFTGRYGIEMPPVEGGCDEWELNYAIFKHEKYLQKFPLTEITRSHNSIILEQLGRLYEKKGDLRKAITYLQKAKEIRYFRPQDLEHEIEKIRKKLEGDGK